jgi:hypothetical protein
MPSIMTELAGRYRLNHENVLDLVKGLTDAQIAWSPNPTTPSIGFHIWHMARWADYLQELFNGRGSQLWERGKLAARWKFDAHSLGYAQTGMEMDTATAMALVLPKKRILLAYAKQAFLAAHQAVATLGDADFFRVYPCHHGENWHNGQIGPILITWMTHDNRHIGMIECLVGLLGKNGSADA